MPTRSLTSLYSVNTFEPWCRGSNYLNLPYKCHCFLFQALAKTFPENTDDHVVNVVTAMMNAVQILFDDEALGHRITLVIKRLEVLKHQNPKDLPPIDDIEKMLDRFCKVSKV